MKKRISGWRCTLNERMRILKLLEEGKITADDAARLLEALGESEARERRGRFWRSFESIPNFITSIITSSMKYVHQEERVNIPAKRKIELNGISGKIEIIGEQREDILVERDGFAKISEDGDRLLIKAVSGDIKITTPKNVDIEFSGVSGDLRIENIKGKIEISSVSGDIEGKGLEGSFIGELVSGDIELEYEDIDELEVRSRSGDILLKLNERIEAEIEAKTDHGSIESELQLKNEVKKDYYLKGILNQPKAKIRIRTNFGDIKIGKK